MKKRLLSIILSICMLLPCIFVFNACGGGADDGKVTVTFMVDDSEYASVEVQEDAEIPTDPTKDDLTFMGWYFDNGEWKNQFTDFTTVTESTTVYAYFDKALTLTYYINNNVYETVTMNGKSAITLPAAPQISGFEFKGWFFKNSSGSWSSQLTENYFVENNTTQNKTVYAKMEMITQDNSASGAYRINGNYLYMGKYPTSVAPKNTSIKSTPNSDGYYEDYSGNLYVKVDSCQHNDQTAYSYTRFFQDQETVIKNGETYYFKVETIKWRILEKDDDTALVMPTQVLFMSDYKAVKDEGIDIRDYANSNVRKYMNTELINKIFTAEERAVILNSWVDNSTAKVCGTGSKSTWADTYDKLYLLDYDFIRKASNVQYLKLPVSDYMRATNAPTYSTTATGGDYGYTYWWVRGLGSSMNSSKAVMTVSPGSSATQTNADSMAYGVVPVFRVDL